MVAGERHIDGPLNPAGTDRGIAVRGDQGDLRSFWFWRVAVQKIFAIWRLRIAVPSALIANSAAGTNGRQGNGRHRKQSQRDPKG